MKKRILPALLALAMVVTMLPLAVFAEDDTSTVPQADALTSIPSSGDSGVIKLENDVTLSQTYVVSKDSEVTLDLNGHKVTGPTAYTIKVAGKLTIIDTSTGNPGEVNNTHSTASTIDVANDGVLILGGDEGNNFIIENAQNKTTKQNSAIKVEEKGTLTINGGTVKGPQTSEGNRRSIQTFGTTTINGGTFEGEVQVWTWKEGDTVFPSTTIINNGIFKDTVAICNPATASDSFPFTGTLVIKDGTFTNESGQNGYCIGVQIPREGATPEDGTKAEISGGTFDTDPSQYLAAGKEATQNSDGKWVVGDPAPAALTFGNANENTECFTGADGQVKTVSSMGTFVINADAADSKKIIVTGSANYMTQTGFNTDHSEEQTGHYLPIKVTSNKTGEITVVNNSDGGKTGKKHSVTADAGLEILIWLDGKSADYSTSLAANTFKVDDYVVDFSGVTMLPKVDEGTKVETTTGEDGKTTVEITNEAQNVGAKLPETLGSGDTAAELSTVKVEVKPAEVSDVADKLTNDSTPEAVKTAVATEGTKLVEVTVKTITVGDDGAVTENETFNTKDALAATPITITIGGLTSGTQYYVFCIMDDGTVTSYGYVTADGTTITLTTKHLCTFGAAPMDQMAEDTKAALKAAVAADMDNHETGTVFTGVDASKTEPPAGTPAVSTDIKLYYSDGGTEYYGGKLEITGLTPDKYYVVTFDYGSAISGGKVPRAAVAVKADANGRTALSCQNNMKVTVQATGADNNVNAGKLTAIFYDPNATNQGILVTNSTYITQSAAPVVGG